MINPVASSNGKVLKRLMIMSLLTALSVVLERFLGYNDRIISVSLGYLPVALAAMLFGPLPGAVVSALADFLGALLFPAGALDLRFTLIAAIKGFIYGYFLSQRGVGRGRIILSQALVTVLCHLTLNTLVISTIIGQGFWALLPLRVVKNLLFFPVEVFTLIKMAEYRGTFDRLAK
ncbi:MAG: folate family ECF transporter S component [Eubacteriales bacterium]|nr:folate family ECF transporter S component [Eubacteriales bacterium]